MILVAFVAVAILIGGCGRQVKTDTTKLTPVSKPKREQAIFAAGCFWGVEQTFRQVKGVRMTEVGFLGGKVANPTYKQVCRTNTGHAEAVRIVFDPSLVSYEYLLAVFWGCHDPTTLNRQGPDVGSQYRSAIFYANDAQKALATKTRDQLARSGLHSKKIVTEINPTSKFYRAGEYHQQYHEKRGGGSCTSSIKKK
ncbi:MAG: peptide-methionine (S)-S-oxide reductase MsrA [Phycisphaerales bacterium]|jgi:peptide-methionine (S)-S-oxide reductase|nr:peptide-methionine (S)-S-oxide reductase MsrA [Phycisphaerales bacterium]